MHITTNTNDSEQKTTSEAMYQSKWNSNNSEASETKEI